MGVQTSRRLRHRFLSIQAQDFIEEVYNDAAVSNGSRFLSIQAQDFIEDTLDDHVQRGCAQFLSIQAQDFIEEGPGRLPPARTVHS